MHKGSPITGLSFPNTTTAILSALAVHHKCEEMSLPYRPEGPHLALPRHCTAVQWLEGAQYDLMVPRGRAGSPAYGLRLQERHLSEVCWFVALIVEHRQNVSMPAVCTLRVQRPEFDCGPLIESHIIKTVPVQAFDSTGLLH